MAHGHLADAFLFHPLGIPLFLGVCLLFVSSLSERSLSLSSNGVRWIGVLVLLVWLLRLLHLLPSPPG
jgi:hypothetical protein